MAQHSVSAKMSQMRLSGLAPWVALMAASCCPVFCFGGLTCCSDDGCAGELPECGGHTCLCAGGLLRTQTDDELQQLDAPAAAPFAVESAIAPLADSGELDNAMPLRAADHVCAGTVPLLI